MDQLIFWLSAQMMWMNQLYCRQVHIEISLSLMHWIKKNNTGYFSVTFKEYEKILLETSLVKFIQIHIKLKHSILTQKNIFPVKIYKKKTTFA